MVPIDPSVSLPMGWIWTLAISVEANGIPVFVLDTDGWAR